MGKTIGQLLRRYPAFFIAFLVLALLEVSLYMIPVEYGEGAGVFLTNQRRHLAEASRPEFDYIIFGDSRSLSLMGHPPTPGENWSVYNFSLPAMGPRYFPFLLKKYLKNRKYPPKAVIFATDPELFKHDMMAPLHDPGRLYSEEPGQSLAEYLKARVVRRVQYLLEGIDVRTSGGSYDMIWDAYSHRYLQLFSFGELLDQYTGPERVFIIKESIPLLYRTYRFRHALKSYVFGIASQLKKVDPLPEICHTCSGLETPACHQELPKITDNLRIAKGLRERYGQINLSDRLDVTERMAYRAIRQKMINQRVHWLSESEPDMKAMHDFVDYATGLGIPVIFTDVPSISEYKNTKYHRVFFEKLGEMARKNPMFQVIRFPDPYYPEELFIEQVHYDCPGARRLNQEFYRDVMPRILQFAPPGNEPDRQHGFQEQSMTANPSRQLFISRLSPNRKEVLP